MTFKIFRFDRRLKGILALVSMLYAPGLSQAFAQVDNNLIYNGDFEGKWSGSLNSELPDGWGGGRVPASNMENQNRPGGKGSKSLRFNMIQGTLNLIHGNEGWRVSVVPVEAGATYELRLWAKPSVDANVSVTMNGHHSPVDDEIFRGKIFEKSFSFKAGEWSEGVAEVKIPEGDINSSTFSIEIPLKNNGNALLLLDDISLVRKGGVTPPQENKPQAPQGLNGVAQQREIEMTWQPAADSHAKYMLKVGNHDYTEIPVTSPYTIEGLTPATNYTIKMKAILNGVESEEVSKEVKTLGFSSTEVIPYLYKIDNYGVINGREMKLYFNDLKNTDATFTYMIDGLTVSPVNGVLTFPDFSSESKKFKLEIHINEGNGKDWKLIYPEVTVKK